MPPALAYLDVVTKVFNEGVPFNRHLGLKLVDCSEGKAVVEINMRPEFIGDAAKNIVHGGIISTLIDVTGGATSFTVLNIPKEIALNTVDMRVDYVRMGRGQKFTATGTVIRKGNRICVTRIEVHNEEGVLIAIGTATYSIFSASDTPKNEIEQKLYNAMVNAVSDNSAEKSS